jgi:adhesin/invasin
MLTRLVAHSSASRFGGSGLARAAALALALLGVMLAGPISPASASPLTVTSCADDGSPGTLRETVAAAADGDTITFAQDCTGPTKIVLTSQIGISAMTLTIDGSGHAVTIDGGGATLLFFVAGDGTLTLSHLTLADGSSVIGGAICNFGTLTVQSTTLSGNTTTQNGGAVNNFGTMTLNGSTLTGNSAGPTGGAEGGGIYNGGTLTLRNSTLSDNTATDRGGGLNNAGGTATVQNTTLSGNSAVYGGGIANSSALTLQNSTFGGNGAGAGGGIYNDGAATAANTILADTTSGGNCLGSVPVTDGGYNLTNNDSSCGFADHAVAGDPLLGALANNGGPTQTQALGDGSPAIAAGNKDVCRTAGVGDVDQRGVPRHSVSRGNCDIGAYDTGAGPVNAAKSTIERSPAKIVADGLTTSAITVHARDANGYPVTVGGANVTLAATIGSMSGVTDNHDGSYTATLTSGTAAGTAKVTGGINNVPMTASTGVAFVAGPASGSTTTISRTPPKIAADGSSTSTITVRAKDQYGNAISTGGSTVTLDTTAGSLSSVNDNGNGSYTATLTSATSLGTATISGTIDSHAITATTTVVFSNPTVTSCADSGAGSLRDVAAGAPSGSTIVFAQNCTISLSSYISIAGTTLTIDGSGRAVTIDGGHSTRLFNIASTATVTFVGLTFANGSGGGDIGGGINNGGTLTVRNSTFSGNSADQGGGIENGGTATVQSSTFSGNSAGYGGGIKNTATLTIDNSTFTGNDGGGASGALDNQATGTITVRNSTFAGNTSGLGGLIYNQGPASFSNTIVSGTGTQCMGTVGVTNAGNTLQFGDTSCGFSITADPLLGSLASNGGPTQTMALGTGSPAIGAGSAATCQATGVGNLDQRGLSRRADVRGRCDIGAYDTRGYVPGPVSAGKSTITRSPASITADGVSTSTITVRARDASGIPIATGGANVTLQTSLGSVSSATDNGDGSYAATLTSGTTAGSAKVTGAINGTPMTATTAVTLTAGPPSAATTTINRSPSKIAADGVSTSTITVRANDQYGNVLKTGGATVTLDTTAGSLSSVTDNGNGSYTATLTSANSPGIATISGTLAGTPITATTTVKFA